MNSVSGLYIAFASISLFACFLQLFLSYIKKGNILILISAILSFTIFIRFSISTLSLLPLNEAGNHLTWMRCQLVFTQAVIICMLGVVFYLLKDTKKIFIFLYISIISFLMILAIILPGNVLFGNKEAVYLHELSNGELIPMIGKGFTWWRTISDITVLLFIFAAILLVINKLKSVSRKNIFILLAGLSLILLAAIFDQLVDLGLINSICILPFAIFIFYLILNFVPFSYLLQEVSENNIISQQEKRWRNLVDNANVIVVGLNRMGQVEFINPFFLKLSGYQKDEVMGKDWFEFFVPQKESYNVQGAFIEILNSGFHPEYVNSILTKSKEEKIIHWFNVRMRDQNENITGSLSIGVDITVDLHEKNDLKNNLYEAQDLINNLMNKGGES